MAYYIPARLLDRTHCQLPNPIVVGAVKIWPHSDRPTLVWRWADVSQRRSNAKPTSGERRTHPQTSTLPRVKLPAILLLSRLLGVYYISFKYMIWHMWIQRDSQRRSDHFRDSSHDCGDISPQILPLVQSSIRYQQWSHFGADLYFGFSSVFLWDNLDFVRFL